MDRARTHHRRAAVAALVFGLLLTVLPSIIDAAVATPAVAQSCPDPTLSPADPRAQWVEGTMSLDELDTLWDAAKRQE